MWMWTQNVLLLRRIHQPGTQDSVGLTARPEHAAVIKAPCLTVPSRLVHAGGPQPPIHAQVTQAIVKSDAAESTTLGIIPLTTANDFATGLRLSEDPWEAM